MKIRYMQYTTSKRWCVYRNKDAAWYSVPGYFRAIYRDFMQYRVINKIKRVMHKVNYLWFCVILRKKPRIYFWNEGERHLSIVVYPWYKRTYNEALELDNWKD